MLTVAFSCLAAVSAVIQLVVPVLQRNWDQSICSSIEMHSPVQQWDHRLVGRRKHVEMKLTNLELNWNNSESNRTNCWLVGWEIMREWKRALEAAWKYSQPHESKSAEVVFLMFTRSMSAAVAAAVFLLVSGVHWEAEGLCPHSSSDGRPAWLQALRSQSGQYDENENICCCQNKE